VRGLEETFLVGDGAGERSPAMAEELAAEDRLGQPRAVHRDEGTAPTGAAAMDGPRHQLLAHARLPLDEHRPLALRHLVDRVVEGAHRRAVSDHLPVEPGAQLRTHGVDGGDVVQEEHPGRRVPRVVANVDLDPAGLGVEADLGFDPRPLVRRYPQVRPDRRPRRLIDQEHVLPSLSERGRHVERGHATAGVAGERDHSVGVERDGPDLELVQHLDQLVAAPAEVGERIEHAAFGLLAPGDVAQNRRPVLPALQAHHAQGQLRLDQRAVFAAEGHLAALAEGAALSGNQLAGRLGGRHAHPARGDELHPLLSHELVAREPQHGLGGRVGVPDDARLVDRDDGVGRRPENGAQAGLLVGQEPTLAQELELRHGLVREDLQHLDARCLELAGTAVEGAQGSEDEAVGGAHRTSRVEANVRWPHDDRVAGESRVREGVRHHQRLVLRQHVPAERHFARHPGDLDPEACLEPLAVGIDHRDSGHRDIEGERGELGERVEGGLGRSVDDLVRRQRGEALLLVERRARCRHEHGP